MSREIFRHSIIPRALFAFFLTIVFVVPSTRSVLAQAVVMCRDRNLNVVPCGQGSSGGSSSRSGGSGGIFRCLFGGCGDDDNSGPSAEEIAAQQRRAAALAANDKGIAAAKQGNWAAAVRFYKEALGYSANDNVIRDNLNKAQHNLATDINDKGNAASTSGNYDDAIEYYKKALANDPNDKVIRNNLAEAQTNQATQQREAEERHRKADANSAEKVEQQRRQILEARAKDQEILEERNRLEKELTEKERGQMDARLRGALGQAQATKVLGGIEFDAQKERATVAAGGALMEKTTTAKDINTTGWPPEMVAKLDKTPGGAALIDSQVKTQQTIRETNENIARITTELKTATEPAAKKKLNQEWADNAQKQVEATLKSEKITKEANKKVIEEVVLETPSGSTTSKDPLQKTEPPPPASTSQPGQ